jgi:hypothetical protein
VRGTQKGSPERSNEGLETCAAVVIDDGHSANPTFTNCFFVRNSVAAAVIAVRQLRRERLRRLGTTAPRSSTARSRST